MGASHPLKPHWSTQVTWWSPKSGGGGRGSAEDPDTRRGEESGPWLQSVTLGVWGIGGLGCGEAADNRGHWEREGPEGPTGNGEEAAAASRKDLGLDHGNSSGAGGDWLCYICPIKTKAVRLRYLVCYTDVTDGPGDVIGLGLCRKVNCSDHTVWSFSDWQNGSPIKDVELLSVLSSLVTWPGLWRGGETRGSAQGYDELLIWRDSRPISKPPVGCDRHSHRAVLALDNSLQQAWAKGGSCWLR